MDPLKRGRVQRVDKRRGADKRKSADEGGLPARPRLKVPCAMLPLWPKHVRHSVLWADGLFTDLLHCADPERRGPGLMAMIVDQASKRALRTVGMLQCQTSRVPLSPRPALGSHCAAMSQKKNTVPDGLSLFTRTWPIELTRHLRLSRAEPPNTGARRWQNSC